MIIPLLLDRNKHIYIVIELQLKSDWIPQRIIMSRIDKPELLECDHLMDKNDNIRVDIIGWYVTEKIDGCRGVWNKDHMETKSGNIIHAPDWFTDVLPDGVMLDGELHMGRGGWGATAALLSTKNMISKKLAWDNVTYTIFDLPDNNNNLVIRQRELKYIIEKIKEQWESARPCPIEKSVYYKVKTIEQFRKVFEDIVKDNGEGVVLRNPKVGYEGRRNMNALKYKETIESEGIVVGYEFGEGINEGKLGSLLIQSLDRTGKIIEGSTFNLGGGFNGVFRGSNYKKSHPIGTIVTYKHKKCISGTNIPRFPIYKGIRGIMIEDKSTMLY